MPTPGPDEDFQLGAASLASRLGLRLDPGGSGLLNLTSDLEGFGSVRRYSEKSCRGRDLEVELIAIELMIPIMGLFVERLYGFSPPSSSVPHLVAETRPTEQRRITMLSLDLLPRVDLAVNPAYVEMVYGPLDSELDASAERVTTEGDDIFAPLLKTPRRRRVLASPWATAVVLGNGLLEMHEKALLRAYMNRWETLLDAGDEGPDGLDLCSPSRVARDRLLREGLADERQDRFWVDLRSLCGDAQTSAAQAFVRGD